VNKLSLLFLILLITNNCTVNKKQSITGKEKTNIEKTKDIQTILSKQIKIENDNTILTKQARKEQELNPTLNIKFSDVELKKIFNNNQNNIGKIFYEGNLEEIGKYKFSKFDNFEHIDMQPVFYNENIIFSDNKGTIIFYDQNQKVIWKTNIYNKNEKKLKPRLNFAINKDTLIVADNVAKYYAINILNGDIIWTKNNVVPFNSEIKIKDDIFYVVDYKNILRSISIKDGIEVWNLKTEESETKSNTKISIVVKDENIYFNNSIGDITAIDLKSGQLVWQLPTQSNNINKNAFKLSNSKLVIDEESIFFSNNKNEFYSIDIATGLINWKNEVNSNLRPIILDKFVITVSKKAYFYIIDKKNGNIIRINNLYKNYEIKKQKNKFTTGFLVGMDKIYLSNSDGKLIIADLNTGNIISIKKISGNKILKPYVNNNNLFLTRNGSIIKFN
jgi:outer membrane protein assembly factor BamB